MNSMISKYCKAWAKSNFEFDGATNYTQDDILYECLSITSNTRYNTNYTHDIYSMPHTLCTQFCSPLFFPCFGHTLRLIPSLCNFLFKICSSYVGLWGILKQFNLFWWTCWIHELPLHAWCIYIYVYIYIYIYAKFRNIDLCYLYGYESLLKLSS